MMELLRDVEKGEWAGCSPWAQR